MDSGLKDPEILSSMLTRLCNLDLLTSDEKLKLDGKGRSNDTKIALFDMLMKKDDVAASKMFLAIRAVKWENDESSNSSKIIRNPMQISLVIKKVLEFLNLEDVKNCRLINETWSFVADPLLTKRSTIVLGSKVYKHDVEPIRSPAKFIETYAESSITQSFSSFRFTEGINLHLSDLTNFFAQEQDIKELAFEHVQIIDEEEDELESYDICDWLVGLPLTKLCVCSDSTTLTLSLDKLHSVVDIKLDGCVVYVPKECRISPISFDADDVTWQLQNEAMEAEVPLNNFIDFQKAKVIKIYSWTKLIFDISKCLHLKSLDLFGEDGEVTIINWNRATATVDSFVMNGIPFLEKTEMKIIDLRFEDASIDLFALPSAIEKLSLKGLDYLTVLCSQPINLPNLKFLEMNDENKLEILRNFTTCPNLVEIDIRSDFQDFQNTVLNTNWVSKSVKTIKMGDVKVVGPILNLETLVLQYCSLFDAAQILKIIKPKIVVLDWTKKNFETIDIVIDFLLLELFKDLGLYLGPFEWFKHDPEYYASTKLASYVDKKASHYLFENYRGKGINYEEFKAMI